jgi:hypothetical protein
MGSSKKGRVARRAGAFFRHPGFVHTNCILSYAERCVMQQSLDVHPMKSPSNVVWQMTVIHYPAFYSALGRSLHLPRIHHLGCALTYYVNDFRQRSSGSAVAVVVHSGMHYARESTARLQHRTSCLRDVSQRAIRRRKYTYAESASSMTTRFREATFACQP